MKDSYFWRVFRDVTYIAIALSATNVIVQLMAYDKVYSIGEMFFSMFIVLGIVSTIAEMDDEVKPKRYTVTIDGNKYQCNKYEKKIEMDSKGSYNGSHMVLDSDQYVAIDDISTVSAIRNPGHPDFTALNELIDIMKEYGNEINEPEEEEVPDKDQDLAKAFNEEKIAQEKRMEKTRLAREKRKATK